MANPSAESAARNMSTACHISLLFTDGQRSTALAPQAAPTDRPLAAMETE
eukprot:CAMPEP_0119117248 /NCGR_PEP_ID=MMETSP1180-20130426/52736_1 /TAXON_ID=3052 ORGANISM="Chlamydomonas cf sp, Strain CCMP681" /NCGR_SAMPLE_ID=MMETSP1180 /ASSEMBLY_ACC=CAM_ASM_000741 /LENGTH=49 /DNA_ID=CAMNT_0007106487 /DNA_START=150 /DNA_END=299 /DNA_ORIENTATION=+